MLKLDYNESTRSDLLEMELNDKSYKVLVECGFFDFIYQETGIFIDDYEDTVITNNDDLLKITEYLKSSEFKVNSIRDALVGLFQKAIEKETAVFFFL